MPAKPPVHNPARDLPGGLSVFPPCAASLPRPRPETPPPPTQALAAMARRLVDVRRVLGDVDGPRLNRLHEEEGEKVANKRNEDRDLGERLSRAAALNRLELVVELNEGIHALEELRVVRVNHLR